MSDNLGFWGGWCVSGPSSAQGTWPCFLDGVLHLPLWGWDHLWLRLSLALRLGLSCPGHCLPSTSSSLKRFSLRGRLRKRQCHCYGEETAHAENKNPGWSYSKDVGGVRKKQQMLHTSDISRPVCVRTIILRLMRCSWTASNPLMYSRNVQKMTCVTRQMTNGDTDDI